MSTRDNPDDGKWLQTARLKAGFSSRGMASGVVNYSPETIGRHERGEVPVTPDDIIRYADAYGSPDILHRYCAQCPVGQRTGKQCNHRSLAESAMRLEIMVEDAQGIANSLKRIAFDGVIDSTEEADFAKAIDFLNLLKATVEDMLLIGAQKRTAPAPPGTALKPLGY